MARWGVEAGALLDPPGWFFVWPGKSTFPTRDDGLDLAARSETKGSVSDSGGAGYAPPRQVLARRNPLFVLRFVGVFVLRYAERTFAG